LIAGICATCGLPKEICVCEDLGRETTQLSVEMDTRRYGKAVTVVRGLEAKPDEAEKLARDLKKGLATGGSGKGGVIVLQGDHRKDVVRLLQSKGYNVR
jgi:translation initiation factor 1